MPFAEPTLPYDHGVLEPHISTETMQFHFGKHNMAYYNKLTALAKGTEWDSKPLEGKPINVQAIQVVVLQK